METATLQSEGTLPEWSAHWSPIYDITRSYAENCAEGPFFSQPMPQRTPVPKEQWSTFLGHSVASTVGVPAGPLLNANYVRLAADLGFDILTYKTIRTQAHPSHPLPNVLFVNAGEELSKEQAALHPVDRPPTALNKIAITNSFGMPSMDPEYLRTDIPRALASLHKGQVLVVSVVGTPRDGEDFIQDFVAAARLAVECGAPIIELNLSCPNVTTGEGSIYQDAPLVSTITKQIVAEVGAVPVIIKVGAFQGEEQMRTTFKAAYESGVQAVSGINTVSVAVMNKDGTPSLGPKRLKSGLCGGAIRHHALSFIQMARRVIDQEQLKLTLIGVGGITDPQHITDFHTAGANAAMSATAMMWDPFLALRYHQYRR